jgi:hypothetical protein
MAALSVFRSQSFFANAFANTKKDFRSSRAASNSLLKLNI